jgi:uncharacterized protein YecT (DUF1311 family)
MRRAECGFRGECGARNADFVVTGRSDERSLKAANTSMLVGSSDDR